MRRAPEPLSWQTSLLHDAGTMAILGLLLVPFYLLLNQYWKSLVLLTVLYSVLAFVFLRVGRYIGRVMRRVPAEIPPWQTPPSRILARSTPDLQFAAEEAMQYVRKDPYYLEDVLKPRLCQLLAYRVQSTPHVPLEALQTLPLDTAVLDFLKRRDDTGLWARYRNRQQRVQDVLTVLRYLETL